MIVNDTIQFPQYRKYKNGKSYFFIPDWNQFEELQLLGSRVLINKFDVKILPDRNLVMDLLTAYHEFADVIEREEYESMRKKAI